MFGDGVLDVEHAYVYLGTIINYNYGNLNKAINTQVSLALRAMFSLITKARSRAPPVQFNVIFLTT
jgi:hypothetical protein